MSKVGDSKLRNVKSLYHDNDLLRETYEHLEDSHDGSLDVNEALSNLSEQEADQIRNPPFNVVLDNFSNWLNNLGGKGELGDLFRMDYSTGSPGLAMGVVMEIAECQQGVNFIGEVYEHSPQEYKNVQDILKLIFEIGRKIGIIQSQEAIESGLKRAEQYKHVSKRRRESAVYKRMHKEICSVVAREYKSGDKGIYIKDIIRNLEVHKELHEIAVSKGFQGGFDSSGWGRRLVRLFNGSKDSEFKSQWKATKKEEGLDIRRGRKNQK